MFSSLTSGPYREVLPIMTYLYEAENLLLHDSRRIIFWTYYFDHFLQKVLVGQLNVETFTTIFCTRLCDLKHEGEKAHGMTSKSQSVLC